MKKPTRNATVYDAVAGRVATDGSIRLPTDPQASTGIPLRPDEVLFKRKGAPQRYEEDDIYNADSKLHPDDQKLPDSDLLKALHAYASAFYAGALSPGGARKSFKSLDETALLAMGILMEEAARETVGASGDLVFTEADDLDHDHDHVCGSTGRGSGLAGGESVVDRTSRQSRLQEHERIQAMLDATGHPDATKKKLGKRARPRYEVALTGKGRAKD
ncbi:hypothetical protein EJ05DRAFT_510096 [Pseudovirgaria hyperparasitica]|uniref:Uncharacterized protein n=1 Tax=Pseudovirgaria hyperparasitica TaxID=470096 RepID=A0A6A6WDR9_9PEZI|nr:uncharacterized protein EJ05DRAFT_510096 [Pseudovirgaria hyperparasitica]KAF2759261.1 hypothetical protein EJ05DRAFT_510096 [Pseudovirgaria hyperparasitica]